MKKFSFLVALLAVMAFATSAFAAQPIAVKNSVYPTADNIATYTATPKVFNADGKTNYPYEIYLPNEANPENYRIHSNYNKNTDACAACHATHTAVGNSLLQWYTVYDTCMACHDGTVTTTYDVQGGNIGISGKATFGGHFGTGAEGSLSNHNVTGAMEIAAAPGGSVVADTVNVEGDGTKEKTRWVAEFGCQSCHTPHGQGGNARILHPDANWTATDARGTGDYFVDVAGYVYKDAGLTKPAYILKGYPYSPKVYAGATAITEAKIDNSTGVSKVVYGDLGIVTKVTGTAALQVKMDIDNYLQGTEAVAHVSGMNAFCGACHTDYNTEAFTASGSGKMETGTYSKAHRHQVGNFAGYFQVAGANMVFESQKLECLTCHVAHGTSTDYWTRTVGSDYADGRISAQYLDDTALVELAGSSALKRLPNMGTCEACHAKGNGNEGYSANTAQADVTPAVGVANTLNYTSLSSISYVGNASGLTGVATATYYSTFLSTFFANEEYVGSTKCASCHKEYYDGWAEEGHSKSFQTAAEFGFAAKVDAEVGNHTINLTTPVTINNVGGTAGDKATGTPTSVNSFTFEIAKEGQNYKIIFDAYKKEINGTYTWNGQVKYDITSPSYVWMEHYTLFDIGTTGITSEVANAVSGANVAAKANTYARAIAFEGAEIEPYLPYGAVLPGFPSTVSWYANGADTTTGKAEGCLSCHAPKTKEAAGTPDITIGCESCHGPAGRHVAAPSTTNIFAPVTAKATLDQQVNLCQTCHSGKHYAISNTTDDGAGTITGFKGSKHFTTAGMTCTTCHDVHNTMKGDGQHSSLVVSKTNKNQLCASCHDTVIDVDAYMNPTEHYSADSVYNNHKFAKAIK